MRKAGERPDAVAEGFLSFHGLTWVGTDDSGCYQRYRRSEDDGIVFASGEPSPWYWWVRADDGRMILVPCSSLFTALAKLRGQSHVQAPK